MTDPEVYLPDWLTTLPCGAVRLLDQSLETDDGPQRLLAVALRLDEVSAHALRSAPCRLAPHSLAFPEELAGGANLLLLDFHWPAPVERRFVLLLDPEDPLERGFLETLQKEAVGLSLVLVDSRSAFAQGFDHGPLAGPLAETLSSASLLAATDPPLRPRDPRWRHLARHFRGSEHALAWITDVPSLRLDLATARAATLAAGAPLTPTLRRLLERPLVH